jgi:hypothetical protein
MCVIIDANLASLFFNVPTIAAFKPVIDWIDKDGKMVYGGKNGRELIKVKNAARRIKEWSRSGKAENPSDKKVDRETDKVKALDICVSNDEHVIALAHVSHVRLLCSHDKKLHDDFTSPSLLSNPRGKVYQNASQVHLLRHTNRCPGRRRRKMKHHAF